MGGWVVVSRDGRVDGGDGVAEGGGGSGGREEDGENERLGVVFVCLYIYNFFLFFLIFF
ncbi:hypothetical protein HanRHA438_Chr11g0485751 [Helianthus annuus]|nr:hypothetical protein HanRHA438_Chr11g0485751 [Helianthus annuus]